MKTKQTVAIIGASGNMGSAIAKSLSKGNYRLLLCTRTLNKVGDLMRQLEAANASVDVNEMNCPVEASWEADIIIMAIPFEAEKEVAGSIREMASQKVVVSIANPLNSAYDGLTTAPGTSAAEELQKLLPHSRVIKAFNTTFASGFASPVIDGAQLDAFLAGNDEDALQTVAGLVTTAGFNPIVTGNLSVSSTLEQMQLLLIQLGIKNNFNRPAGWKILH